MQALKLVLPASLVLVAGAFCTAADRTHAERTHEKPSDRPVYRLPKDPKATVVSLDVRGEYASPRTDDDPTLSILADGTLIMPATYAHVKAFKGKLTKTELQELLHFIIGINEFFKYDSKAVTAKVQAEKQRLVAAGGAAFRMACPGILVIRVDANGKSHEISHQSAGFDEHAIKESRQRQAIQKRLQQVMSIVRLGGNKEVAKWLKLANKELKAKHPAVKSLTREHLASGDERPDGSKYVSFMRMKIGPNGKPVRGYVTGISINQQAGKSPKVNVVHRMHVPKRPSRLDPGSEL